MLETGDPNIERFTNEIHKLRTELLSSKSPSPVVKSSNVNEDLYLSPTAGTKQEISKLLNFDDNYNNNDNDDDSYSDSELLPSREESGDR